MGSRREALLSRVAALPEELLPEVEQSVEEIVRWHDGVYRLSEEAKAWTRRTAASSSLTRKRQESFATSEIHSLIFSDHPAPMRSRPEWTSGD